MMASDRSWRHRNTTFWFSDTFVVTDEGTSAKSIWGGGGGGEQCIIEVGQEIEVRYHS